MGSLVNRRSTTVVGDDRRGRHHRAQPLPPRADVLRLRTAGHAAQLRFDGPRSAPRGGLSDAVLRPAGGHPPQAPHRVSGQRNAADRGGDGPRGLHGERVDPLPPPVAVPREGARRVRADRARRVGAGRARPPALRDGAGRALRRRDQRPARPDVERRRRDLALSARAHDGLLLPERRARRDRVRPRGHGHARDDLRRRRLQGRRLRRHPARHDVSLRAGGRAAASRLRVARADDDPRPLPQRVRPAARGRAVLEPRPPSAGRAADASRARASSSSRCASAAGTRRTSSTTTRSTSSAGTATSSRGRSPSTTSSRSRAASTSRRRRTRRSRGRTSSSARSARASSTSTRRRSRSRTTTRISSPRR